MTQRTSKRGRYTIEHLEARQLLAAEIISSTSEASIPKSSDAARHELVSTNHYVFDGKPVALAAMPQRLAVRWADGPAADLPLFVESLRAVGDDVFVYRVPAPAVIGPNVDDLLSRFSGYSGEVPVYQNLETGSEAVLLDEVIVSLADGTNADQYFADHDVFRSFRRLNGTPDQYIATVRSNPGDSAWKISEATLEAANRYNDDKQLEWAAPNFYQSWQAYSIPNDPRFGNQWHAENTGQGGGVVDSDVDLDAAWDVNAGGSANIVVGVVDDGVATNHEDILNYANPGEIAGDGIDNDGNGWVDDVFGWNFVNDTSSIFSTGDPHGTSVAGVAAGIGDNGVGIAGAAYNSPVLTARIFDGEDVASDADIAAALYYMGGRTADGTGTWRSADVVNNSWGGGGSSAPIEAALQWGTTQGRQGVGAVYLFATGNEFGAVSQPALLSATIPGVVAVGATNNFSEKADYSNFGSQVDLVTPSNDSRAGYLAIDTTDIPGSSGYASGDYTGTGASGFGGTSSATPLATGITALALAELSAQNVTLSPAEMRLWLRTNTDLIGGYYDPTTGHNDDFGYGRLNAGSLLQSIGKAEISVTTGTTDLIANVTQVNVDAFVGQRVSQTLRIRNQGTSALNLAGLTISAGSFTIASLPSDNVLDVGEWTTVELAFSPTVGGSHAGLLTIQAGSAPFTGRFIPQDPIGPAIDGSLNGDWTLEITDVGEGDTGTLEDWSIRLIETEPTTTTDTDGFYAFSNLTAGTYDVSTVQPAGWQATGVVTRQVIVPASNTAQSDVDFGAAKQDRFYGRVFDDLDGDGDQDAGEVGLANETVFLDPNGDGQLDPEATVSFVDSPFEPIVDVNTTTVTQEVSGIGDSDVLDLDVRIDFSHTYDGDLEATLISPDGTEVILFSGVGGPGGNFTDTVFDDDAADPIQIGIAPFTGSFRPQELLADLYFGPVDGTWTLEVTDNGTGDVGTLNLAKATRLPSPARLLVPRSIV